MATPEPRDPHDTRATDSFDALLREAARLAPGSRSVPLHPGRLLCDGRFELLRRIGAGGSGVVYAARDHQRGTRVALKLLSRIEPTAIYGLKSEFRGAASLTHPNLVRLLGLFADGDEWLLTMELVDGVRFDEWVRPGGLLDAQRLCAALAELVAGVRAIHGAGKVHRDLKPSNVLVTSAGRVVVLDFGLVSSLERGGNGQTVDDGFIRGTPAYMAPEQAAGAEVGPACDWYAVGTMIYEALSGELPFDGPTLSVLGRKQLEDPPALPAQVRAELGGVADLCAALLARDPAARPDGRELAAVLGAGRGSEGGTQPAPRWPAPSAVLGRAPQLAALQRAFHRSAQGTPVVVSVCGEAGVGKTALVEHFLDVQRADSAAVVLSGRIGERESLPYRAIDPVVDDLTRHLRRLGEVAAAGLMPRDVAELARIFPALRRIECAASAPLRPTDGPQTARRRAFDALTELLARVRDRQPLVVFVDDMQWADPDSLRLLEHWLAVPEPAPSLVIFAFSAGTPGTAEVRARVARAAAATGRVHHEEIDLPPLDGAVARALIADLLVDDDAEGPLVGSIADEAGGNPMLIRQLSRHVASRRAAGETQPIVSWRAALGAEVGALEPLAATLLELLSLSGGAVPRAVVASATGATPAALQTALDALEDALLVADVGSDRVECRHHRIAAAVRAQTAPQRQRLHHRALATAWAEHPDAEPELLHAHWVACGDTRAAARCAVAAAARARDVLALERSAELLTYALAWLPESESSALRLRQLQAEALSMSGRWSAAAEAFDEAAQRSVAPGEQRELMRRAAVHGLGAGRGEALPRLRAVLVADGLRWPRTAWGALGAAAVGLWRLWWMVSRGRYGRDPGPEMETVTGPERAALERLFEAAVLVPPHDFARGAYFVSRFAARGLRTGDAGYRALSLAMLAVILATRRGARPLSQRLAAQASELARRVSATSYLGGAALSIVALHSIHTGRCEQALRLTDEALATLRRLPAPRAYEAWAAEQVRACSLLMLGRAAEAADSFASAARAAPDLGDGGGGDAVLRHLVVDDPQGAHALLARKREALQRASGQGTLAQVCALETVLLALYEGRGAEVVAAFPGRASFFQDFLNVDALLACCALQAPGGGRRARRRVRRSIARLEANADLPASAGIAAQLDAACRAHDGDIAGARGALATAMQRYQAAGMAMHVQLLRMLDGRLQGSAAGEQQAMRAEAELRARGIASPEAWARMVAPGLSVR